MEPVVSDPGEHTILLVEDDELVMEMALELLKSKGYRVFSTYLPSVALELISGGNIPVDLLVTDLVMPQMNGTELYRRIQEQFPDIPVLYMSGYSDTIIQGVLQGRKHSFIPKPFTAHRFLDQVARLLPGQADCLNGR